MDWNDDAEAAYAAAMERLAELRAMPTETLTDEEKKEKLCVPNYRVKRSYE
jgi:hypothetical protein